MAEQETLESLREKLEEETTRRRGLDAQHQEYLQGTAKLKAAGFDSVDDVLARLQGPGPQTASEPAQPKAFNADEFLDDDGDYKIPELVSAVRDQTAQDTRRIIKEELEAERRAKQLEQVTDWITEAVNGVGAALPDDEAKTKLHGMIEGQLLNKRNVTQADVKAALKDVTNILESYHESRLTGLETIAEERRQTEPPAPTDSPGGEAPDDSAPTKPVSEMTPEERIAEAKRRVDARLAAERRAREGQA